MFAAEAAAEIVAICGGPPLTKKLKPKLSIVDVYAYFDRATPMPEWLRHVVVSQPTEIDIQLAAQAWAENSPEYLGDLMLWSHECPIPDDAMIIAGEIAKVACYRQNNGLTGEPWAASAARLGGDVSD